MVNNPGMLVLQDLPGRRGELGAPREAAGQTMALTPRQQPGPPSFLPARAPRAPSSLVSLSFSIFICFSLSLLCHVLDLTFLLHHQVIVLSA